MEKYSDTEITEALHLWVGEWFPSVKEIRELLDRRRDSVAKEAAEAKTNAPFEQYKADKHKAESEGLLATQEQYDELREVFRRIAFGANNGEGGKASQDISARNAGRSGAEDKVSKGDGLES